MAETLYELQKNGILKTLLHGGKGEVPNFPDGAKATFHYRVSKPDEEKTVLDDSRKDGKPMELIFGKKFKLEVWEDVLKTMKLMEVAEFKCDIKHTSVYPIVAKSLRDIQKGKTDHHHDKPSHHCCGMMAVSQHGMGYPDLDELVKNPQPLIFTIELLKLEQPEQYEKETWSMDAKEKFNSVPNLKDAGNKAYSEKLYDVASEKYAQAIGILEDLMLQEKPGDEEWLELDKLKRPLLLNFSQCKLLTHDYYTVITHTTDVLEKEPENIKALFRRAKAHAAVWDVQEAKSDFEKALQLDPNLAAAVKKELASLEQRVKAKDQQEKSRLKGMFS